MMHLCIDLRGALTNFKAGKWRDCCTDDDGKKMSPHQVQRYFLDQLALGRRVVPMGKCEGFDYQTGCPGHWSDEL
jgi:hypothetical protein